jgi:hypothetical protein
MLNTQSLSQLMSKKVGDHYQTIEAKVTDDREKDEATLIWEGGASCSRKLGLVVPR